MLAMVSMSAALQTSLRVVVEAVSSRLETHLPTHDVAEKVLEAGRGLGSGFLRC